MSQHPGLQELKELELEELLLLIADKDVGYKEQSMATVFELGLNEIYPFLEMALRDDARADVRNGAMEVLVAFGEASVPRLVSLLADANEEVRIFSAVMLGKIGSAAAAEALITVLRDPDINVRHSAAEALGEIGDGRAVVPLQDLLKHEIWLLYPAIHALGLLGQGTVSPLFRQLLPPGIIDELVHELPPLTAGTKKDDQARMEQDKNMKTTHDSTLPDAGLADDILARFAEQAQLELDRAGEAGVKSAAETILHLVTFQLGREEYGVDIGSVQEIIRATDITPVPGAHPHVRGIINLRGKIIPVVDLRTRFALPQAEDSDSRRIVVVELNSRRIGMLVDSVSQVIKVPAGVVEDMPEETTAIDDSYIKGVGKLANRLIIILDLNRSLLAV